MIDFIQNCWPPTHLYIASKKNPPNPVGHVEGGFRVGAVAGNVLFPRLNRDFFGESFNLASICSPQEMTSSSLVSM